MSNPVMTNNHLAWLFGPESALTEEQWVEGPSLAAVQSLTNLSAAVKVDGTDFNVEASEQVDDRSFADQAGAQSRGPVQASGNVEIYTPGENDTTSIHAQAWDIAATPRTRLALGQRLLKEQGAAVVAGDEINLFRVITDDTIHNRNEASRTLGIGLRLQDNALINYIVPATVPNPVLVTVADGTSIVGGVTIGVGETFFLDATYEGRIVTVGAEYRSSNEAIFEATGHGILIGNAVGEAQLLVTIPGSAAATPITVTVE